MRAFSAESDVGYACRCGFASLDFIKPDVPFDCFGGGVSAFISMSIASRYTVWSSGGEGDGVHVMMQLIATDHLQLGLGNAETGA